MLEARLNGEVPPSNTNEVLVEEGTLEEFLGEAGRLDDVDKAFEAQLAKEIASLDEKQGSQARRVVAKLAREHVKSITEQHGAAIPSAREAINSTLQASTLADFAAEALRPFATLAAQLLPEAARHAEVEYLPGDASTLRPRHKWFKAAVGRTLAVLTDMREMLARGPPTVTVQWHDEAWEGALSMAEQQWQGFCDAHPPEECGPDTPREEEPLSPVSPARNSDDADGFAQQELRDALMVDDDLPAQGGGKSGKKTNPPKLKSPSAKAGPPGPPALGKPPASKANASGKADSKKGGGKMNTGKKEEMKAMLANLDKLTEDMDSAMGKTAKITRQNSGAGLGSAPPPPAAPRSKK